MRTPQTLNNRCRIIMGTQKGTLILTTTLLVHVRAQVGNYGIFLIMGNAGF